MLVFYLRLRRIFAHTKKAAGRFRRYFSLFGNYFIRFVSIDSASALNSKNFISPNSLFSLNRRSGRQTADKFCNRHNLFNFQDYNPYLFLLYYREKYFRREQKMETDHYRRNNFHFHRRNSCFDCLAAAAKRQMALRLFQTFRLFA